MCVPIGGLSRPRLFDLAELEPNARLLHREDLTPSLCILRVAPESGSVPPFEPGQFFQLGLPEHGGEHASWIRRSYSIASPPGLPYLEVYLQIVDGGAFSELARELKPGARLWLGPRAHGNFTLEHVPPGADIIAVATGTGLAPFRSMLAHHAESAPWRRFVLMHGARLAAELGYRAEFEARAARDEAFRYLPTVTREPEASPWRGLRGRVPALLEPDAFERLVGFPLQPAQCHVMLCGNPRMIEDVRDALVPRGFEPWSRRTGGNLHFERYW